MCHTATTTTTTTKHTRRILFDYYPAWTFPETSPKLISSALPWESLPEFLLGRCSARTKSQIRRETFIGYDSESARAYYMRELSCRPVCGRKSRLEFPAELTYKMVPPVPSRSCLMLMHPSWPQLPLRLCLPVPCTCHLLLQPFQFSPRVLRPVTSHLFRYARVDSPLVSVFIRVELITLPCPVSTLFDLFLLEIYFFLAPLTSLEEQIHN